MELFNERMVPNEGLYNSESQSETSQSFKWQMEEEEDAFNHSEKNPKEDEDDAASFLCSFEPGSNLANADKNDYTVAFDSRSAFDH